MKIRPSISATSVRIIWGSALTSSCVKKPQLLASKSHTYCSVNRAKVAEITCSVLKPFQQLRIWLSFYLHRIQSTKRIFNSFFNEFRDIFPKLRRFLDHVLLSYWQVKWTYRQKFMRLFKYSVFSISKHLVLSKDSLDIDSLIIKISNYFRAAIK